MKRLIGMFTIVGLVLLFSGCSGVIDDNTQAPVGLESVAVCIPFEEGSAFEEAADSAIVRVLKNDTLIVEKELVIENLMVTGRVDSLPPCKDLDFLVQVFDSLKNLAYEGEAIADIEPGKVTNVDITLRPKSGSAIINGKIEEEVVLPLTIGSADDVVETFISGGIEGRDSSWYTDYNYGLVEWMILGEHDSQSKSRILIKFAQDAMPTQPVTSAKLQMTVSAWVDHSHENTNPMTVAVHKMLRPWGEGNVETTVEFEPNNHKVWYGGVTNDSLSNGATSMEAFYGDPWNERLVGLDGVDATADYADTTTHNQYEGVDIVYELDITEYVNAWIQDPSSNNGVLVRPLVEDYNGPEISFPLFYTWEHKTESAKGPKLLLE